MAQNQSLFCCPLCGAPLAKEPQGLSCPGGHRFDRARSGYVNLLPPGSKASKQPGDNKEMVSARVEFLGQGHYLPLAQALAQRVAALLPQGGRLLDAGCGEGYYDQVIWQQVGGENLQLAGVDISKFAVEKAAKALPQGEFGVGSLYRLPLGAGSFDLLLNLFAPHCPEEFHRVLAGDGRWILAAPGPRHLWELKAFLYEQPYENPPLALDTPGFAQTHGQELRYTMALSGEQLWQLFQMTPYYYKSPPQAIERLRLHGPMEVTAEFIILEFQRLGD